MWSWVCSAPKFPLAILILMVGGSIEAFSRGDWRYGVFWMSDAIITGWSSFMLRP
jgi:hypothetical protein